MVGGIFLSEGIQKFIFPGLEGIGRFIKIGVPFPEIVASIIAIVEIVCGISILLGFFTRLAAIPLLISIFMAIISTKIPILLGHDLWMFHVAKLPRYGFWSMAHEARADFSMLLGLIFLFIVGAGRWSIDSRLQKNVKGNNGKDGIASKV